MSAQSENLEQTSKVGSLKGPAEELNVWFSEAETVKVFFFGL